MAPLGPVGTGLAGVVFGLALAAPPGPMNAVIAEESVLRGWLAGVKAGAGAFTADVAFFVLSLAGVVTVVDRITLLRGAMVGIGGVLMCYFGYGALQGARSTLAPEAGPEGESKGFRKALVLALTNPYQILFWLTVGVGLLEPGSVDVLGVIPWVGEDLTGLFVVETGTPWLLGGLFAGIAVWVLGFPAALVAAKRRVERLAPAVAVGSAIVLFGFGVAFLLDAGRTLLGG